MKIEATPHWMNRGGVVWQCCCKRGIPKLLCYNFVSAFLMRGILKSMLYANHQNDITSSMSVAVIHYVCIQIVYKLCTEAGVSKSPISMYISSLELVDKTYFTQFHTLASCLFLHSLSVSQSQILYTNGHY